MKMMDVERRLVAVFAADVKGYSGPMVVDEVSKAVGIGVPPKLPLIADQVIE